MDYDVSIGGYMSVDYLIPFHRMVYSDLTSVRYYLDYVHNSDQLHFTYSGRKLDSRHEDLMLLVII